MDIKKDIEHCIKELRRNPADVTSFDRFLKICRSGGGAYRNYALQTTLILTQILTGKGLDRIALHAVEIALAEYPENLHLLSKACSLSTKVRQDPETLSLLAKWSKAAEQQGEPISEIEACRAILKINPADLSTMKRYSDLDNAFQSKKTAEEFEAVGKYFESIVKMEEFLHSVQNHALSWAYLGKLHSRISNIKTAAQMFSISADIAREQGREGLAISGYSQSINLNAKDPLTHQKLAEVFTKQGEKEKALVHLKTAMMLFFELRERLKASAMASLILEIDPENVEAANMLSSIVDERDSFPSDPESLRASIHLGQLQLSSGQEEEGLTTLFKSALSMIDIPLYADAAMALNCASYTKVGLNRTLDFLSNQIRLKGDSVLADVSRHIQRLFPNSALATAISDLSFINNACGEVKTNEGLILEMQFKQAEQFLRQGEVDKAIIELQSLLNKQPRHLEAHRKLVDVFLVRQKVYLAVEQMIKLSALYRSEGDLNRSKAILDEARALDPLNRSLWESGSDVEIRSVGIRHDISDEPYSQVDPRVIDSTTRYKLPFPVASLYRHTHSSHEPQARLGYTLRMAEGLLRFLAYVNLADAASRQMADKYFQNWLSAIEKPGMGKLLGLFRSILSYVPNPFIEELRGLTKDWWMAASSVIRIRNRLVHDKFAVGPSEAELILKEIQTPLRVLLTEVQFLQRYHFGIGNDLRWTGKDNAWIWYPSRGIEETGEPLKMLSQAPPVEDVPMLLEPRSRRALYLSPWFIWSFCAVDGKDHFFWLQSLERKNQGTATARYKHPLLDLELEKGLPTLEDCRGEGLSVEEWLRYRHDLPPIVDLGLHPISIHRLVDPLESISLPSRYKIIGKIGKGNMGTVWHAIDEVIGRHVAVKVLNHDYLDAERHRRFLREGKNIARVRHPGVVQVLNLDTMTDGSPVLVMEFVEGESLQQILSNGQPLQPDGVRTLVKDILKTLHHIHECGIVHRDIKPSNIIISPDGVKILDFGIALHKEDTRVTRTLDGMGTPGYMAPEQWEGKATPQSDIFAVGRLLFTMLVGHLPSGPEDDIEQLVPEIDARLANAFRKASQIAPIDRFSSAIEMAESL